MGNELSKQPVPPVQPVRPMDQAHAQGGQADQQQTAPPDQKRGPSDAPPTPGQSGPSVVHPDVQNYLNLEKQGPNTSANPAHSSADAIPLQTTPQPATDHTHQTQTQTPDAGADHVAEPKHAADAAHPADTKHPAETTHSTDSQHPADANHAADPKHSADSAHSADSPRGSTPASAHVPGAHDRTPDARTTPEVHETPADRALRLHLQPFGVTPEQARDYIRIALVPQLHLDPIKPMRPDDIQRTGNAVSHLSPQQLEHLTAQAKAADAGGQPGRQTLDLSRQPAVARFGLEHPIDATSRSELPKAFQIPRIWPDPVPRPPLLQQGPGAPQSDYAKKLADAAAQGHPSHRVPDIPDSERVKDGSVGDVFDAIQESLGLPKVHPDSDGTLNIGGEF